MKLIYDIVDGLRLTEIERVARIILSLPLLPDMKDEDEGGVVNAFQGECF